MVLTAAQIQLFFIRNNGMAILAETIEELANKGINNPLDLTDFDKDL